VAALTSWAGPHQARLINQHNHRKSVPHLQHYVLRIRQSSEQLRRLSKVGPGLNLLPPAVDLLCRNQWKGFQSRHNGFSLADGAEGCKHDGFGDLCYVRQGTYRETVQPANSGTTFMAYPGESVTISGADLVARATVGNAIRQHI